MATKKFIQKPIKCNIDDISKEDLENLAVNVNNEKKHITFTFYNKKYFQITVYYDEHCIIKIDVPNQHLFVRNNSLKNVFLMTIF